MDQKNSNSTSLQRYKYDNYLDSLMANVFTRGLQELTPWLLK